MPHDAREIANFLLDHVEERHASLTIMVLLKLIYFAHGWHLARYDKPLIKNSFEAWKYGPVVRAVYEAFPNAKNSPITARATILNPLTGENIKADYSGLGEDEKNLLVQIYAAYGHFGAFKLSDLTHEQDSPWDKIWNNSDGSSHPGMRITDSSIKMHFQRHYPVRH